VEHLLGNLAKADEYAQFAARLKAAFNKPVEAGGFWDAGRQCYVHWLDKDGSVHGRNTVTPVNFMAIAYGICEDSTRSHAILEGIERRMQQENLFFWPLCMDSYAPGEGNDWQWPFPNYENGDLFLSWGSVAVNAYAHYRPEIAVKYIRRVLDQYGKDGLAFQRYGRHSQQGLGDDILSGNSLSIVGLYQSIYGINPKYNRLLLAPHLVPELAGTELNYRFRGKTLVVGLSPGAYSIRGGKYTIAAAQDFGFWQDSDSLCYFAGPGDRAALVGRSGKGLKWSIPAWDAETRGWKQESEGPVAYLVRGLKPGMEYYIVSDGKEMGKFTANAGGELRFLHAGGKAALRIDSEKFK
jgi:hypothetical protein